MWINTVNATLLLRWRYDAVYIFNMMTIVIMTLLCCSLVPCNSAASMVTSEMAVVTATTTRNSHNISSGARVTTHQQVAVNSSSSFTSSPPSPPPPPPPPTFAMDRFMISFWVDPIVPVARFDAEYARVASANFTVLLGGFGANTPATVAAQIASARRHNLAALPSACGGGACSNLTGAWGFQIKDEPNVRDFAALAPAVAAARARGQVAFVNLLPNYATPGELGASTYGEYVDAFMDTVRPNMLCVDHYPDFDPVVVRPNKTKAGYIDNLLVLRAAAQRAGGLPVFNFFNTMPYNVPSQFDISEAEMRWQAYTSLATGVKGVLYFCYWTPPGADL